MTEGWVLIRYKPTEKVYIFHEDTMTGLDLYLWELLAESEDYQLLLTMLELTRETT